MSRSAVIGENLKIRRFEKVVADNGVLFPYIHGGGRIGVLVEAETDSSKRCRKRSIEERSNADRGFKSEVCF